MAVPDYQSLMLPLLQFTGKRNEETTMAEAVEALAQELALSPDDLSEMLPSGYQSTMVNRTGWASTYMKKAGLLEATRRGYFRITPRGKEVLAGKPARIDVQWLKRFPEFLSFYSPTAKNNNAASGTSEVVENLTATPSEALEAAYANLREQLSNELLDKLKNTTPAFFERVVVELLVKMGYGGSRADAGRAIGRSGDGGIDGIIKEDKLGLDVLYIQAKRWGSNSVGRPDVMQFAGALQGQRANKGIFITTSKFTEGALQYVSQINSKIVLIDGEQLTKLMIEHDVGVSTVSLYPVKRIDSDYFDESL